MTYVNNINNESNKKINIICNPSKWKIKLLSELEAFYKDDPNFRVCIASQSSGAAISIEDEIRQPFRSEGEKARRC